LRFVCFNNFYFTRALIQAIANALMEGTTVTALEFKRCSFSADESAAQLATGLSRNTSVISFTVVKCNNAQALLDALAAALPSNSSLRHLELIQRDNDDPDCLSPVFSALGYNTGIKSLKVHGFGSMDESLCTAMKDGLGMNETLEILELYRVPLCDESADLCCRAFSFLRTNKTLKSLVLTLEDGAKESCLARFRIDTTCMLQENASLESLSIQSWYSSIKIKAEEYFVLVTALQHNPSLKILRLYFSAGSIQLTDDESKRMAALLQKNYALECLPDINLKKQARDIGAILRLNGAGRRYLVQDGSSVSKGVQVLSRVNDDINCVFLHLLENPRLCDRSAVEMVSGAGEISNGSRSTNPDAASGEGKREHASAHKEGKESRRRLT
jgi:hypothetical protein